MVGEELDQTFVKIVIREGQLGDGTDDRDLMGVRERRPCTRDAEVPDLKHSTTATIDLGEAVGPFGIRLDDLREGLDEFHHPRRIPATIVMVVQCDELDGPDVPSLHTRRALGFQEHRGDILHQKGFDPVGQIRVVTEGRHVLRAGAGVLNPSWARLRLDGSRL